MRLIDKDALPSALFQRHVHDDEELEPMLYFEYAVKVVENAPTIDAIPVEWLKGLMLSTEDDVDKVEFAWIMREWQEEQEART